LVAGAEFADEAGDVWKEFCHDRRTLEVDGCDRRGLGCEFSDVFDGVPGKVELAAVEEVAECVIGVGLPGCVKADEVDLGMGGGADNFEVVFNVRPVDPSE
jgi:hypothetical protein